MSWCRLGRRRAESRRVERLTYYLQPLVVKARVDGSWELVDGQQRLTTLYLIFRYLKSTQLPSADIAFNPADTERGVELPRPKRHRVEVLSEHKVAELLNAVEGTRLYLPVLLAVTTGMRRGEILALCWDDVDLVRGTISVVRAWDEGPSHYEMAGPIRCIRGSSPRNEPRGADKRRDRP